MTTNIQQRHDKNVKLRLKQVFLRNDMPTSNITERALNLFLDLLNAIPQDELDNYLSIIYDKEMQQLATQKFLETLSKEELLEWVKSNRIYTK
jgi:hypothetical protein